MFSMPCRGSGPAKPLFLVNEAWANRFFSSQPKTKITNAPLVDLAKGCHKCRQVVLRQGLEEGKDFRVVEADLWAQFCVEYGADYVICRFRSKPLSLNARTVKGETVKGEHTKKSAKKKAVPQQRAAQDAPRKAREEASPLALFPESVSLHYQTTDGDIVECRHSVCAHPIRIPLNHGASVPGLEEAARHEITKCMDLDLATYEWLQPSSHRFDCLYYDRKLEVWTPWRRAQNRQRALPADLTRVISPEDSELKLCLRTRMRMEELTEVVQVVDAAEKKYQAEERRKRKQDDTAADASDDDGGNDRDVRAAKRSKRKATEVDTSDEETESDSETNKDDAEEDGARQHAKKRRQTEKESCEDDSNECESGGVAESASSEHEETPSTQEDEPSGQNIFGAVGRRQLEEAVKEALKSQMEDFMRRLANVEKATTAHV